MVPDAGPERLRGDQVAQRAEHEAAVLLLGAVDLGVVAGRDREVHGRVLRQAAQVRARGGGADAEVADHAEREVGPGAGGGVREARDVARACRRTPSGTRRRWRARAAQRATWRRRQLASRSTTCSGAAGGPEAERGRRRLVGLPHDGRAGRGELLQIGTDLERARRRRRDARGRGVGALAVRADRPHDVLVGLAGEQPLVLEPRLRDLAELDAVAVDRVELERRRRVGARLPRQHDLVRARRLGVGVARSRRRTAA